MTYSEIQEVLMREMALSHNPIAVKFFFDPKAAVTFLNSGVEIHAPCEGTTFCQWECEAREQGKIIYADEKLLGCNSAKYSLGWKELDEHEICEHSKHTRNREQATRFAKAKLHLQEVETLVGIAVLPLYECDHLFDPDTVHCCCTNMQAYDLAVGYMAGTDTANLRPRLATNAAACGGNVCCYIEQDFTMLPACSCGKNLRMRTCSEMDVMIPGAKISALANSLAELAQRVSH